ncbi:uncharacterized protein TNCV_3430491 [Trichonephila clavipes]|nr:uncharacterized protein TNCV_3430491 [Trichonephila clavipes]
MCPNNHSTIILKRFLKFENIGKVQRHWRQLYGTESPTRFSISRLRDMFEIDGTIIDMHKGRSNRLRTSTNEASSVGVLDSFTRSPQKSTSQSARETGVSWSSVGPTLHKEMTETIKVDMDLEKCSKDLIGCQRQMENARKALMSEVEAKALTLNISRRTQHAEPLLGFPYTPADHHVDQIYHPDTEEDWERNLENKIQKSVATRTEASTCNLRTAATVKDGLSKVANAWYKTSKALQEAVQRDEKSLFNVHNRLRTVSFCR